MPTSSGETQPFMVGEIGRRPGLWVFSGTDFAHLTDYELPGVRKLSEADFRALWVSGQAEVRFA